MKRQSLIVPAIGSGSGTVSQTLRYEPPEEQARGKRKLPSSFTAPPPAPPMEPVSLDIESRFKILFPFQPYDCQAAFIRKLGEALLKKEHALLESPTGTGKTMCLLSTVLAFQHAVITGQLPFRKKTTSEGRKGANSKVEDADELLKKLDELMQDEPTAGDGDTHAGTSLGGMFDAAEKGSCEPSKSSSNRPKLSGIPRVWYASRTHSQLKQVVGELKKSVYYRLCKEADPEFAVRLIVMGSRDHYCVNPELADKKGRALESQCRRISVNRTCLWHNGCNSALAKADIFARYTMDIDESKSLALGGTESLRPFCPFYASRETQQAASFILLPYNYLVNPMIREQMKIDVTGDIVIVDEGHNLETTAEDETSFTFTEHDLMSVVSAVDVSEGLLEVRNESAAEQHLSVDDVKELQTGLRPVILALAQAMRNTELNPVQLSGRLASEECRVWTLQEFRDQFLSRIGMTQAKCDAWTGLLKKLQLHLEYFEFHNQDARVDTRSYVAWSWIAGSMSTYLHYFWDESISQSINRFRVGIFLTQVPSAGARRQSVNAAAGESGSMETSRQLHFWSFAPHVGLEGITSVCHSLIVTSGTLKPLDCLALQLGNANFQFPHQLENKHVITQAQLFSSVIRTTINDVPINLSFDNLKRAGQQLIIDIGNIIVDIVSLTPREGHLVFFASYSQMNNFIETWSRNRVMFELQRKVNVFKEPKSADEANTEIKRYCVVVAGSSGQELPQDFDRTGCKKLSSSYELHKGGIFFGVCRGRVSEGLSLSDSLVRTVSVIGIPYPALTDVKLHTKRAILDRCPYRGSGASGNTVVNGSQWYMKQAYQAVNQAIGRIIRHRGDYGAIILLDGRYAEATSHLSGWVRENLQHHSSKGMSWKEARAALGSFFRPKLATQHFDAGYSSQAAPEGSRKKRMLAKSSAHSTETLAPPKLRPPLKNPPKGTPTLSQLFASRAAKIAFKEKDQQAIRANDMLASSTVSLGGADRASENSAPPTNNRFKLGIKAAQAQALAALIDCDDLDEIP